MRARERQLAVAATVAILAMAATPARGAFPDDPPNDPLYDASPIPNWANEQWDLASPADGFDRGISVDRAWRLTTGAGAIVADIDLGVDLQHVELEDRWYGNPGEAGGRAANGRDDDGNGFADDHRGWDFYARDNDPTSDIGNSHGTQVAGVLGAATDNGIGIAGIAPDARIMPLRTADNIIHQGARLAQAIVYASDHGADVISMSLGADSFSDSLRNAVAYAADRGTLSVVAAGNEFHFHRHLPQYHDDAIAVGGVNPDTADARDKDPRLAPTGNDFTVHASYSNYGPHLDVVAPVQVPAIHFGGGTELKWAGTSAATPHVAGVATLVAARARERGVGLRRGELQQIIRMSADDLTEDRHGYASGWDRISGWGRVNALAAVEMSKRRHLPPVPNITSPGWYEPNLGRVAIRGSVRGRSPSRWRLRLGHGEQPSHWRRLASGRGTRGMVKTLARLHRLRPGGYTLELRARDRRGNVGEDRAFFEVLDRRGERLRRNYPRDLGASGESSPALANLDGRDGKEIVLATTDGRIAVLDGRKGRPIRGWPKRMHRMPGSKPTAERIGAIRSGFVSTPAIGDIAGGPEPEIVVGGLDGKLYAWNRRGRKVPGFPYRISLRAPFEGGPLEGAIYASPALADLRGDRKLEIVFGGGDQRIYAIDGRGRDLPGWPVLARDGDNEAKILSSPAIGDLDGDGSPDIVEGTGEAYGETPATTARAYAFDIGGDPLPGWPVSPTALAADSIPIVGEGVPVSPALADVDGDGDDEVALAAFTGAPELYDGDGTRLAGAGGESRFQTAGTGPGSPATAPSVLALGANGAFGRTSRDGALRFFGGVVDTRLVQAQLSPATKVRFEHLLGGWDAASGSWVPAFPIPMEGWEIASAPAIADVSGNGAADVVDGSSGNLLHAIGAEGSEPPGWPKRAAGWLLASPAVGNVDGDGRNEVVAVTRSGYLYVWNTPAKAGPEEWPSFRHDPRNTGNYGSGG